MTVSFLPTRGVVQPIIEVLAPPLSPSGLYEVTIWQNRNRDEGLFVTVATHADVERVVELVKARFTRKAQL